MLVIVKQMLIEGKETFQRFYRKRMKLLLPIFFLPNSSFLEEVGIIIKTKRPDNKKTNHYLLTEKGLALTPILVELAIGAISILETYIRLL
jgi:hypothetical protein